MYPYQFLGGALTMGYVVLGIFFLKFWRRTRDPLFKMFAYAFCLMAFNGFAVSVSNGYESTSSGAISCACSLSCSSSSRSSARTWRRKRLPESWCRG